MSESRIVYTKYFWRVFSQSELDTTEDRGNDIRFVRPASFFMFDEPAIKNEDGSPSYKGKLLYMSDKAQEEKHGLFIFS